jgi:HlyD family secretion protein
MNTKPGLRKRVLYLGILAVVLIGVSYLLLGSSASTSQYLFATVTRGNIESTISSTGTLTPVTQVEVGTQVSGIIDRVLVDFNDHVRKGQVLAVLDTLLLHVAVTDAESGLKKAEAQLEEAQANFKRSNDLYKREMISESDFLTTKVALKTAEAEMESARSSRDRARQNMKYAIIRAPIDGTVTSRNVEAGQTVAASFSTPTLFMIAEDLSKMQILALVDESDIGQIRDGQDVKFDVQAYPDKKFSGKVKQIRLQPTTVSNVVNYTVVVEAANPDHLLLPGMTATVDFVVAHKSDVLLVPNTALRFQPSDKEMEQIRKHMQERLAALPDSVKSEFRGRRNAGGQGGERNGRNGANVRNVFYLDAQGNPVMARAVTGMTDGTNTEIVRSRGLEEGTSIIVGTAETASNGTTAPTNQRQPGFGPRGF